MRGGNITQSKIQRIIASMRRRYQAVIAAQSVHISVIDDDDGFLTTSKDHGKAPFMHVHVIIIDKVS